MSFELRKFSDDEAIRRVWDAEEIKNLIGRFAYYEAGNSREQSLKELWVAEPKNTATASFGRNWGFCVGMEAIEKYYVEGNRFGDTGTSIMHPFSTKLLCIAEDGKTAQGLWMGISYETAPNADGDLEGKWINERMAIDFIKEKSSWRIWHIFIGTNFVTAAGKDYTKQPLNVGVREHGNGNPSWYMVGEGRTEMTAEVAKFDQIPEYQEREVFCQAPTHAVEAYTALYNDPIEFPHLPVDYETFEKTTGYDYEGFCSVSGSGKGKVI